MTVVRRPAPDGTDWLPVGAASRRLGVDPDTLRRWADAGRVDVFTTPGGHRRFSRSSLDRLATRRAAAGRHRPVDLSASSERIAAAYRRRYQGPDGDTGGLFRAIAPSDLDRASFRDAGRHLVDALVRYVDAGSDESRSIAEVEARASTVALARQLARRPIPDAQSIEAFISARRPFLTEIARISRRRSLSATEVSELYERSNELLDGLVVLFAATLATGPDAP
ncbi:MAG: helix-turn-helix domain-containing protein [Candidatus Limnocylindrales bacterium]